MLRWICTEKTAMPPLPCPSPRAGQIGSKAPAVVERRQEAPPGRSASARARKSFPKIRKTVMMLMMMMMMSVPGQHSGEENRTRWCYCTRRTAEDSSVHKQRASSGSLPGQSQSPHRHPRTRRRRSFSPFFSADVALSPRISAVSHHATTNRPGVVAWIGIPQRPEARNLPPGFFGPWRKGQHATLLLLSQVSEAFSAERDVAVAVAAEENGNGGSRNGDFSFSKRESA